MRMLCAVAAFLVSGCAGTDGFVVRVLEYGASAGVLSSAELGGCAVHQQESPASASGKQSVDVRLTYTGQKCSAEVVSRKAPVAAPK